jgi:hypothetical protein
VRLIHRAVHFVVAVSTFAVVAVGCGESAPPAPVARIAVTPSKPRLPLGAPVDVQYRFELLPSASITGDYAVFVQVKNNDGDILWQDDHRPPVPTSQWKPGQPVEYTRTRFVPVVAYLGDAVVEAGLYRENERLVLEPPSPPSEREAAERSYRVATLHLLPTSETVFVIYKTGWHPDEYLPEDPSISWKWMQKTGVLSVRNPRKDVTLYFEYDARPDLFPDAPQQVTMTIGDQTIASFAASSADPTLLRIPITAAQLGSTDLSDIRIDLDRTFVPAKLPAGGKDARELGIRVYHAFVEER